MNVARTTIETSVSLMNKVKAKASDNCENIGDFITRALLNQLEAEGDFEVRDEVEVDIDGSCEKKLGNKKRNI